MSDTCRSRLGPTDAGSAILVILAEYEREALGSWREPIQTGTRSRRGYDVLQELCARNLIPKRVRACSTVDFPIVCGMIGLRRPRESLMGVAKGDAFNGLPSRICHPLPLEPR